MTDDNLPNTDAARAREGMVDELKTINKYEEMADESENPAVADTLREVADDEKVHVGNFGALVAAEDPDAVPKMMEGVEETVKDTGIQLRVLKRSATEEFQKAKPLLETPLFEEVGGTGVMRRPQDVLENTDIREQYENKKGELEDIRETIQDLLNNEKLFKKKNPAELDAFAHKLIATDDYLNHDLNEFIYHLQSDDLETLEGIYSKLVDSNPSISPTVSGWFLDSIRDAKEQNAEATNKINTKMEFEAALRKTIANLEEQIKKEEDEKKEVKDRETEPERREILSGYAKPQYRPRKEQKSKQQIIYEKMDALDRARFGGVDPATGKETKGVIGQINDLLNSHKDAATWLIGQLDEVRSPRGNYSLFLKKDADIKEALSAIRDIPSKYEWKWKKNADPELVRLVALDKSLVERRNELGAELDKTTKTLEQARREQKEQEQWDEYNNGWDEEEKQWIKEKQLQEQKDAQLLREIRSRKFDQDTDEFDEENWYDTNLVGDTYYTTSGQAINPFGYHYADDMFSPLVNNLKKRDGGEYGRSSKQWFQGIRDAFNDRDLDDEGNESDRYAPLTDDNAYSTYTFPKSTLLYRTSKKNIVGALAKMGITTVGALRKFISDPNGWPAIYERASQVQQAKIRNSNLPVEEQQRIKKEIMARTDITRNDKKKIIDTMFLNEEDQRDMAAKMPHLITGRLAARMVAATPWGGKKAYSNKDKKYIRDNFAGFGKPGGSGMTELSKYIFGKKADAEGNATEEYVFPDEMPLREYDGEQPGGEDSVEARSAYSDWIRNNYFKSSYSAVERAKIIMALIGTAVQTVRDPNATPEAKAQAIKRAKVAVDAYEKGQKLSPSGNPLMSDKGILFDKDLSRDPIGKQLIDYIRNKPLFDLKRKKIPQDQISKMRAEDAQKATAYNENYDQELDLAALKNRFADIAEANLLRGIYSQGLDIQNDLVKQKAQYTVSKYLPKVNEILSSSNKNDLPPYVKEALTDVQNKLKGINSAYDMRVKGTEEYEATRGKTDKKRPNTGYLFGDKFQKYAIPMIDKVAEFVTETPEGQKVFDREGYYNADIIPGSFDTLAKKILKSDKWKKDVGDLLQKTNDVTLFKKYSSDNPNKPTMAELLMDLTKFYPAKIMKWVGGSDWRNPRRNLGDTAAELYLLRQDENEASVRPESVKWMEPRKDRIGSHVPGIQLDREFNALHGKKHDNTDGGYETKKDIEDEEGTPPSWDDEFWDFEEEEYLSPDAWYAKYGDDPLPPDEWESKYGEGSQDEKEAEDDDEDIEEVREEQNRILDDVQEDREMARYLTTMAVKQKEDVKNKAYAGDEEAGKKYQEGEINIPSYTAKDLVSDAKRLVDTSDTNMDYLINVAEDPSLYETDDPYYSQEMHDEYVNALEDANPGDLATTEEYPTQPTFEGERVFRRSATNEKRPPLRVERVFSQAIPFYGVKLDLNDNEPFDAAKYKMVNKEVQGSKRTNIDRMIAGRQKH